MKIFSLSHLKQLYLQDIQAKNKNVAITAAIRGYFFGIMLIGLTLILWILLLDNFPDINIKKIKFLFMSIGALLVCGIPGLILSLTLLLKSIKHKIKASKAINIAALTGFVLGLIIPQLLFFGAILGLITAVSVAFLTIQTVNRLNKSI